MKKLIPLALIILSIVTGLHIKNTAEEQQRIQSELEEVELELKYERLTAKGLENDLNEANKILEKETAEKIELEDEFDETGNKELIELIGNKNELIGHLKGLIKEKEYKLIDKGSDIQHLHDKKRKLEGELE